MSNKAQKFYYSNLINKRHILVGSLALKLYNPNFRDAKDVDITFPSTEFAFNYLSNMKDPEFKITDEEGSEYEGLISFRLAFNDGSFVDVINAAPEFEIINNIKVGTLKSILYAKKRILFAEIEKENPRIEVIKKHYNDLKFLNNI